MSKSSFLNNKKLDKSNIAVICILGMVAGFLVSRAGLSLFMFLFGLNALRGVHPRNWLKHTWWLVCVAWVAAYGICYFWSDDKGTWYEYFQVKIPFLILPLAIYTQEKFSERQLRVITMGMSLMFAGAALYSLGYLVVDPQYYITQYKYSHMLPTLPKRDHIRASLAMVLFIVWAVYMWPRLKPGQQRWIAGGSIALLVIYLHILAAKTGLLSMYIFFAGWGVYVAVVKKKVAGLLVILAIPVFVMLGIRFIPTLRERYNYIDFTIFMLKHGDKSGNYGDIGRLLSYKIGLQIIQQHPLTGVGSGDLLEEMNKIYDRDYPAFPETGRLVPHNQFLSTAACCGIPAALVLVALVLMPLRRLRKDRESFFLFLAWLLLMIQLMIEPALEVQMGIFVFLFFLLMQMMMVRDSREIKEEAPDGAVAEIP